MPAEPTKAKLKRRSSRKDLEEYRLDGGHLRELELKRNRGEVSCAECRRLKIKCDKQIPCQSCQRRGCEALCPNGSLATGQGTRFVLAATEHLHKRIGKLNSRIRQLEDALASVHGRHSDDPHPLLTEDLISVDEDIEIHGLGDEDMTQLGEAKEVLDSFGTLSISEHGVSRFFGPTGGSESLLLANLDSGNASPDSHTPESSRDSKSPGTSSDLQYFSQSFPFTPMGKSVEVQRFIESKLPAEKETLAFCDTYFEQVAWLFRGVTKEQVVDDMLPVLYKRRAATPGEDYSGPHDLALIFVILAIGALVGQNSEALGEHYHQIARAAVSLQPVLERPSYVTIQVLHLMSMYNAMSGTDLSSETSMELTWSLVTLASHLSQTIGLHRDSARWGLPQRMVQRRRILFWDMFVADIWQSLCTGRPPAFSLAYIDCVYPQYEVDDSGEEGSLGSAFEIWQFRFAAECVAEVTARTLTTEAPSYSTILELDQKVRNFPLPEAISSSDDFGASFQRCVLEHIKETILMYIHRSFFAQAIIESPENPIKSNYATSFLAAYRASSTILKSVKDQYNVWANATSRFWTMWTFAFSAAVVFGTIVTRGPRSPLAKEAMGELEQACHLFAKAAQYSIRAAKALPILIRLSEKARQALQSAERDPNPTDGDQGGLLWNIKKEDTDDELSILSGRTRFVSSKRGLASETNSGTQSVRTSPPPSASSSHAPNPSPTERYQQQSNSSTNLPQQVLRPIADISGPSTGYMHQQAPMVADISSSTSSGIPAWSSTEAQPHPHHPYMSSPVDHNSFNYPNAAPYGWSSERSHPHVHPQVQTLPLHPGQSHIQHQAQYHIHPPPPSVGRYEAPQIQHHRPHYAPYPQPRHYQLPHSASDQHQSPYARLPPPSPQGHSEPHSMHGNYPVYGSNVYQPAYPSTAEVTSPAMVLADLGLASRDSRLDERWGMFMADSGILEDYRQH